MSQNDDEGTDLLTRGSANVIGTIEKRVLDHDRGENTCLLRKRYAA